MYNSTSELRHRTGSLSISPQKSCGCLPNKPQLITYAQLPDWRKDNDFILDGYVPVTNSFAGCSKSLLYIHNETVNIMTHLLPGSLLPIVLTSLYPLLDTTFAIPRAWLYIPVYPTTGPIDSAIFGLFFFGFVACLSLSAIFHTVKSHSLQVANFGNSLDYAGIVIMIACSLFGIVFYALCDMPLARLGFLTLTTLFGAAAMVTTFDPLFKTPEYRPFRSAMFIAFGLSGVLPIAYGLYKVGFEETADRSGLPFVLGEAVGYIVGAVLYAMRVPERWSPGTFDIWGHSHQIFHVLVVLSAFSHFRGLVQSYTYAHAHTYPNMS